MDIIKSGNVYTPSSLGRSLSLGIGRDFREGPQILPTAAGLLLPRFSCPHYVYATRIHDDGHDRRPIALSGEPLRRAALLERVNALGDDSSRVRFVIETRDSRVRRTFIVHHRRHGMPYRLHARARYAIARARLTRALKTYRRKRADLNSQQQQPRGIS